MAKRRAATDAATKALALQRATEVGPAAAGRELGIPASTIRAWQARARGPAKPADADGKPLADEQLERLDQLAKAALAAGSRAISRCHALIDTKPADAQRLSITAGVMIDKAATLERELAQARAGRVELAEAQAQLLAAVVEQYHEALGLPQKEAARAVLGELLTSAGRGEVLSPPARSEEARGELLDQLQASWGPAEREGPRALPAPPPQHPDGLDGEHADLMVPTVKRVRVRAPEVEVVDAEVVDESPRRGRSGRRTFEVSYGSDGPRMRRTDEHGS